MMAILTSDREDFFLRIPRIPPDPELMIGCKFRLLSVTESRIPVDTLLMVFFLLHFGHVFVYDILKTMYKNRTFQKQIIDIL